MCIRDRAIRYPVLGARTVLGRDGGLVYPAASPMVAAAYWTASPLSRAECCPFAARLRRGRLPVKVTASVGLATDIP